MTVQARDFLKARRDRAVGTILGYAEREIDWVDNEEWQAFRALVLDAIDNYHDTVLDLFKSDGGNGEVRNEEIISLLEDIHNAVQSPVRV